MQRLKLRMNCCEGWWTKSDLKPIVAAALYFELPFAYFMGLNCQSRTALLLGDLKLNVFSLHDAHGPQALARRFQKYQKYKIWDLNFD
jgi:hypothetical protein